MRQVALYFKQERTGTTRKSDEEIQEDDEDDEPMKVFTSTPVRFSYFSNNKDDLATYSSL